MSFIINTPHYRGEVTVTPDAEARARCSFNPSANEQVTRLKLLAAAFYTEIEKMIGPESDGHVEAEVLSQMRREAATAMTHIQAGAMFAVSVATAT